MIPIRHTDLGRADYRETLELQRELARDRRAGTLDHDVLLTVEHEPVITLGRSADRTNVVAPPTTLEREGARVVEVERGGDVTYHGPGQLVAYPILDLTGHRRDLHWYLRRLEEALIRTLDDFDLRAYRVDGLTGVWVGEAGVGRLSAPDRPADVRLGGDEIDDLVASHRIRKIASIGVHASRWVTSHGVALNVTRSPLEGFGWISPCGIPGVRMTSLAAEGKSATIAEARRRFVDSLSMALNRKIETERRPVARASGSLEAAHSGHGHLI